MSIEANDRKAQEEPRRGIKAHVRRACIEAKLKHQVLWTFGSAAGSAATLLFAQHRKWFGEDADLSRDWTSLGIAIVGGGLLPHTLVFLWHLIRVPFRQRDEAWEAFDEERETRVQDRAAFRREKAAYEGQIAALRTSKNESQAEVEASKERLERQGALVEEQARDIFLMQLGLAEETRRERTKKLVKGAAMAVKAAGPDLGVPLLEMFRLLMEVFPEGAKSPKRMLEPFLEAQQPDRAVHLFEMPSLMDLSEIAPRFDPGDGVWENWSPMVPFKHGDPEGASFAERFDISERVIRTLSNRPDEEQKSGDQGS